MTKIGLIQFVLLLLISAAYGQKVKYKDIYALLSTKQYKEAEPFLRNYLQVTGDNPNAFLFMGIVLQEKAVQADILEESELAVAHSDSAITYFKKAVATITDRELRKNKEYYQSYNRRDLRTGQFGLKLSDVQFDIEKRIEGLRERMDKIKMVKHYFSLSDSIYRRANRLFVSLQNRYPSENQLYLRADEKTLQDLAALQLQFDSCVKAFDLYKTGSSSLRKKGSDPKLLLAEIADFKNDGRDLSDFYLAEVKVWDYKSFADKCRTIIEQEMLPTRKHLLTYDVEIKKLRKKLQDDSVSVRNDLTKLIDRLIYEQMKKYDPEPLPMTVFALKTTELEYRSLLVEHQPLRDSADIHLQVRLLNEEITVLSRLDSLVQRLPGETVEERALDYAPFVTSAYGAAGALKSYIHSVGDFTMREQKEKNIMLEQRLKSLNYIVDGADSIPLSPDIANSYKPLVVTPEKFTLGLSIRDTTNLLGYFYTITSSRKPQVKALFPLDKNSFRLTSVPAAKALAHADAAGAIYYVLVYSEQPTGDKFPATLAKIYRSDGLAWRLDQPLTFTPSEMILTENTGELLIRNESNELVVDKNGKVVR
jgi:hypothetical protein